MPRGTLSIATTIIAPLASATLLVFAFPRFDVTACVWVGLVPLLVAMTGGSSIRGFLLAYLCGIGFFNGVFSWSFEIPGYEIYHQVILAIVISFYFGIFGLIFSYLARRLRIIHAYLCAPFVWVCMEYARSNLSILSLPWPLLAHSQYQQLTVIQISSLTGAFGVSFFVVLINVTISGFIYVLIHRKGGKSLADQPIKRSDLLVLTSAALLSIFFVLIYGRISLARPLPEKTIKLSVLQGNVDQGIKRNPSKHATFILQQYMELSEKARLDEPDLIVWPEAATPGLILRNVRLYKEIKRLISDQNTHFLIGSSEFPKFEKTKVKEDRPGNTALLFSPQGKIIGQYLKIRLLPFGEYVPYGASFPWPRFIVPEAQTNWEISGTEATLFELNGVKFGVVICWENAFPTLFRRFVKNGANFMVNITNEGWFGESAAPYQFLAMSVFRAVENRISLARAANTGVSCFIDPKGRILDRVRVQGKDIYVAGYLTGHLYVAQNKTFYTRFGDIFVMVNIFVTLYSLIIAFTTGHKGQAGSIPR